MKRLRSRPKSDSSRLEAKFALYWRSLGGSLLVPEFRFDPDRKGVPLRGPRGFGRKPMFLDDMQFVVPNAMIAEQGYTKDGRESVRCRDNAARHRRFIIVEFDQDEDEYMQPALHWHLRELATSSIIANR